MNPLLPAKSRLAIPLPRTLLAILALSAILAVGCASPAPPSATESAQSARSAKSAPSPVARGVDPGSAVRTAESMLGVPYKYGGASPRGFDCSGLVIYSYAEAGLRNLPHSADALSKLASRVPAREIAPGDLVFFQLRGPKPSHVGIYVGDGEFIHAPSSGKRVERESLDNVYWGRQRRWAGRLVH